MNPANVSLAQLGMSDEGPIAMIDAAAAAGFGAVGLPLKSGALKALHTEIVGNPALIREIVAACRETGVSIFDVEALVLGHLPPPEDLQRLLNVAATLGATRISCLGYEPSKGGVDEKVDDLSCLAAEFDLRLCIEFMAFRSINSLAKAVEIIGHSAAGIVLDALHVQRTGATVADIAALPAGIVSHLQLCDAAALPPPSLVEEARGGRLLPGEGAIPLAAIIDALPKGTPMSLEIPTKALAGLPVAERARIGAASIGWL